MAVEHEYTRGSASPDSCRPRPGIRQLDSGCLDTYIIYGALRQKPPGADRVTHKAAEIPLQSAESSALPPPAVGWRASRPSPWAAMADRHRAARKARRSDPARPHWRGALHVPDHRQRLLALRPGCAGLIRGLCRPRPGAHNSPPARKTCFSIPQRKALTAPLALPVPA